MLEIRSLYKDRLGEKPTALAMAPCVAARPPWGDPGRRKDTGDGHGLWTTTNTQLTPHDTTVLMLIDVMSSARVVFQAPEKIDALCAVLYRAGKLTKPDRKALSEAAGVSYSTLKSAVQQRRLSSSLEDALAALGNFDREHPSWVDETVPEGLRRLTNPDTYPGRDTVAHFRNRLTSIWQGASVNFRANPRNYSAFDPHLTRHELSDLGQATPAGLDMQFFLTAYFEPFYHHSGIAFGFRKAAITVDIECSNGAKAKRRFAYPAHAMVRDAVLKGDGMSRQLGWTIERQGEASDILKGEYSTGDDPLVTVEDYGDGTALTSRVEVNIYDRATYYADASPEVAANKQALIEQIFCKELPEAEARNGWIILSCQETVIARYER